MSFSTEEPLLEEVLNGIDKGEIQLPDFQRGWVWDDEHISSLIASISLSYPIGVVMFLQAGTTAFKPRLFEGVTINASPKPKTLVLDGQQRLTSMYLALKSGAPVPTRTAKGGSASRVYFLDMTKCLDAGADREEAVISVPDTLKILSDIGRTVDLDLSTPELQFQQRMFPVSLLFNVPECTKWKLAFSQHHNDQKASEFLMAFENEIWMQFKQFKVPVIKLTEDTPREAVCQVFEKVNTAGVTLTVFELMTATFASGDFQLRDDWEKRTDRMTTSHKILSGVNGTSFLTAVTLCASYDRNKVNSQSSISCKRGDILRLKLSDYKKYADKIEAGFKKAAEILAEDKIFDERSLPYPTQLVPLACICTALKPKISNASHKTKLMKWYWCGVFGELYSSSSESRSAQDLPDVAAWINGGAEPRTVRDSSFAPVRLLSLQTRQAAAYKGISALLMKLGSNDFISGTPIDINTYFNNAIDIHHICPRAWCESRKLPKDMWNSVVNKAPLASSTNTSIGGVAPSVYLARIEKKQGLSQFQLDSFLATHAIPVLELRSDDFPGFIQKRASMLLDFIENATGKKIAGRDIEETVKAFGAKL